MNSSFLSPLGGLLVDVLAAGVFADISTQDAFCSKGGCVISNVFDQSPNG